ncbi:MAG: MFS transporter [Candidatus Eremiobacteraeota bacterium]|nr:MFS transporter [Candidatus Eremiobacteraeota bacterium]
MGIAGGTAFLDMYATQPLLPELRVAFGGANEATVAATVSSLSFGVALAAPLIGPLADRIGRKRVIVSAIFTLAIVTFFAAQAHTLAELIAWRFVHGLAMPGIFAVTLAYIAEEFPSAVGGRAIGAYICGNVVGGFLGRYISAFVAARADWHAAFVALGALNVAGGIGVLSLMPSAQNFRARAASANAFAALGGFLRSPATLAVYGVGAAVLFTLVAAFTFATFHLAAAPYSRRSPASP